MPAAEEVTRPITESGDEDSRYAFRAEIEASRIRAAERETMRAITARLLRANAAQPLSDVFTAEEPTPAVTTCAAIDEYLSTLAYGIPAGIGRMAAELAELEARIARRTAETLRMAAGSTGRAA